MAETLTLKFVQNIADVPQSDWDAMALPLATPFLEWAWLHNLEMSGSAIAREGWQPVHLTAWRGSQLIGAAPLYLKAHSYGEFVFDHQWVDVAARLGIRYYPKLLGMTPFTPAVGYRFLIAPGEDEVEMTELMLAAIEQFCQNNGLPSCNFLFVDPEWKAIAEQFGYSAWLHHSYIWDNQNEDLASFDDYLKMFNANQRRNIKRERKAVGKAGLRVETHAGEAIPEHLFPSIYRFYSSTCDKFMWGSKYLTRKFFQQLYPDYCHRIFLVAAYTDDEAQRPAGLSFCVRKGENLYGRYWGCFEEYDCLHFEACYYKPIEWALEQGIKSFDPGAGGRHKRRRGFPATPNHSLHRYFEPRMNRLLQTHIGEINEMEQEEIDAINQDLPFAKREVELNTDVVC
ncbi:MAG: GNAT family N-acetyltransferase [Cyanobacteria bacterium J06641_5]